jgi:hypothetical protein
MYPCPVRTTPSKLAKGRDHDTAPMVLDFSSLSKVTATLIRSSPLFSSRLSFDFPSPFLDDAPRHPGFSESCCLLFLIPQTPALLERCPPAVSNHPHPSAVCTAFARNPKLNTSPKTDVNNTMAQTPSTCRHSFRMIKSDTSLLLWNCGMCASGPHWAIFECVFCRLKACRPCTYKT